MFCLYLYKIAYYFTIGAYQYWETPHEGVMEEIFFIAMKLPFLPSVRPMRKCKVGKQNFTQVLPWAN